MRFFLIECFVTALATSSEDSSPALKVFRIFSNLASIEIPGEEPMDDAFKQMVVGMLTEESEDIIEESVVDGLAVYAPPELVGIYNIVMPALFEKDSEEPQRVLKEIEVLLARTSVELSELEASSAKELPLAIEVLKAETQKFRRDLRWINSMATKVRDLHVQVHYWVDPKHVEQMALYFISIMEDIIPGMLLSVENPKEYTEYLAAVSAHFREHTDILLASQADPVIVWLALKRCYRAMGQRFDDYTDEKIGVLNSESERAINSKKTLLVFLKANQDRIAPPETDINV